MPTMTQAGYTPPKEKKPPEPPKPDAPKKRKKKKKSMGAAAVVSLVIFLIAVCVGAATIYVYMQTQPYVNTFCPGASLSGYPLAGATWDNARALLAQMTDEAIADWSYTLSVEEQTYTLTAEDVGLSVDVQATLEPLWESGRSEGMLTRFIEIMTLRRNPVDAQPVLIYDMTAVDELLARVQAETERDPLDATVTFMQGNSEPFRFTDEQVGYALDISPLRLRIEQALEALTSATTRVSPTELAPNVYRAELENAISLRARVTVALSGGEAAGANAALAASMFDGLRIEAGESCSFNDVVGKRTAEGGYVTAPESAYGLDTSGAVVSGVGGGVCQTATALYRAALLGGVQVEERHAAVRPVDFCDMGMEATVSDQGLDLVLRNDTDMPLFVTARTYMDGDTQMLEIQIIGKPLDVRYTLVSQSEQTEVIEEPIYVRDRDGVYATYTDERVPVGEAQPGYRATVTRVAQDSGESEVISQDTYEAVAPTVYVGVTQRQ